MAGNADYLIFSQNFSSGSDGVLSGDAAISCTGLGVILAAAATLHRYENGKKQQPNRERMLIWFRPAFLPCLIAFLICGLANIIDGTSQTFLAIIGGILALAVGAGIRRFNLGPWGISGIVSLFLFVAVASIALRPAGQPSSLALAFSSHAPKPLVEVTERMLAETSWFGTGAGTFAAVLPIYQNIDEQAIGFTAPTAAAAIAVEMGQPFLWAALISAGGLVFALLAGALRRQRDSIYSLAGASCVVVITLQAFVNATLFSTPILILAAAVIGVALAQSKSRFTTRNEIVS